MSYPAIGGFEPRHGILIREVENGGWIALRADTPPGGEGSVIGAFSSAEELLTALSLVLVEGGGSGAGATAEREGEPEKFSFTARVDDPQPVDRRPVWGPTVKS